MLPDSALTQSGAEQLLPALITIPAGFFLMGCDTGQDNEKPVHRVWIDEFLLAACQVSNAEYARFLLDTRSAPFWNDSNFSHPQQPVVGVSWHEAVRYCEWLSVRTGHRFRLPAEAEWERAARGGRDSALYPWGDAAPQSLPGYADRWKSGPEPAGSGDPNTFGLFNMCDNGTLAARKPASGAPPAVAPGAITSRCRAAPLAPAFLQSSDTPTTASGSPATLSRCKL